MALGGGSFTTMNKVLPGAYINFVSSATANSLGERGTVAMGFDLNWGNESGVFEVTSEDLVKNSQKLFGYAYDADELRPIREIFLNATKLLAYRLNGNGTKAANTYAEALYSGTRGNDLKIVIAANVDDEDKFDVTTILGTAKVDTQTVASSAELVANDYVSFKIAELELTAGTPLTGGANGTDNTASHQGFLNAIESYSFNAIGVATENQSIDALYVAFSKRMRNEVGKKFQCVVYNMAADFEGVVNVKNKVNNGTTNADLVYFTAGIIAGTPVNGSCLNAKYNGEYDVDTNYTQSQLEDAIRNGQFTFHLVDNDVRILDDINSLVTTTDTKGDIFKENRTIRVIDEIATNIANLFVTKYLGVVPNDASGRISLWNDIVKIHNLLQDIRAIENFDDSDVVVTQGDDKKAVVVNEAVEVVYSMAKLYMTCSLS